MVGDGPFLFSTATDPTAADLILKSWSSFPIASQHPVAARNLHVVGSRLATDRESGDGHNSTGAHRRAGVLPPHPLVVVGK